MYLTRRHMGGKLLASVVLLALGHSCINEDLSDCGTEFKIHYEVKLENNLQTELDANLKSVEEKKLGNRLKEELSQVFTNKVRDFDLRFYVTDSSLLHQEKYLFDPPKDNLTKTLYLPIMDYQHIAMANNVDEHNVSLEYGDRAEKTAWVQKVSPTDTLESYEHGLFSGRLKMEVKGVSETFFVNMYMQNAAAAVVINPGTVKVDKVQGTISHLANGFMLRDSVYFYHDNTVIRAKELKETGSNLRCLYGVGLPSRDFSYVRATEVDEDSEGDIWLFRVQVVLADGKVVPSILRVKSPLKAGHLKLILVNLNEDGGMTTVSSEVGASADLEWRPGGEFNPEL